MKSLVLYYSHYGNTRKVAETIAARLDGHARDLERFNLAELKEYGLILIGCPTHRLDLPEQVCKVCERLPQNALRGKWVAAFDTSYKSSPLTGKTQAGNKLREKMRNLGGWTLTSPESFYVIGREGPLCAGELERAAAWAEEIKVHVEGSAASSPETGQ